MHQITRRVARALLEAGAVVLRAEQPFRFASGILSPVYCDNRLLTGDVERRRLIAGALADGLRRLAGLEVVVGTATAGIAWAAWSAELLGLPMAYVRSAAKGHGKGNLIEGGAQAGQRVALIEDTISTGGSSLSAAAALRDAGLQLEACLCIFSYEMRESQEAFASAGLTLQPLTTLETLLEVALEDERLSDAGYRLIREWAADPRGWRSEA